ncbi:MAG: methyltransferase [Pirellulaceae bacterium]
MHIDLPPLPTEQLLIEHLPNLGGRRALVVSPGRAQLATHLLAEHGYELVTAWYLDLFAAAVAGQNCDPSVTIACSADLPTDEVDLVAIPVLKKGEAELTRDLMQQAHERLCDGGYLAASVNNPTDQWLHEQMRVMFAKVTCQRTDTGCVYWGKKSGPLKKFKSFECQFSFRDEGKTIHAISRPGVFSHRRLDGGARQLMLSAEIGEADQVLDMGCGAGTVSLSSAFKTTARVIGVDSNARAIECVTRGAELNGLQNVTAELNADGRIALDEPIDLALANPPYFGDDGIAAHFVDTCISALRPGGALLVVTKQPNWYGAYFERILEDIVIFESSQYFVACGRKP